MLPSDDSCRSTTPDPYSASTRRRAVAGVRRTRRNPPRHTVGYLRGVRAPSIRPVSARSCVEPSPIVAAWYRETAGKQSWLSQIHEYPCVAQMSYSSSPFDRWATKTATADTASPIVIDTPCFVHGVTRRMRRRQRPLQHRSLRAALRLLPTSDLLHALGQQSPIPPYRSNRTLHQRSATTVPTYRQDRRCSTYG